jgi:tetratricopeptide (TPR) repeat protein
MGRSKPTHINDPAAFGRRARELRDARGLSLRQASFEGCSPSFLSRVEAGERVPSPAIVAELARRLDVRVEELLGHALDNRVSEGDLVSAEVAARLGDAHAEDTLLDLLAQAEQLGDQQAQSRVLEALGLVALDARSDERAIDLLEQARAIDPEAGPRVRPSLHRALGRAYAGTGDLSRAIAILDAGFTEAATEPADAALLVAYGTYLANAYTDAGRFAEAETVLARALSHERELEPGNLLRLEWALARTYAEEGKLGIAEAYTRRALNRLDATENASLLGQAHLLLAGVLLDQERTDDAVPHLDQSEQLLADEAPVELSKLSLERARVALAQDDLETATNRAREALDRTESTEPGQAGSAYALLSQVELRRDNLSDARFLCTKAIELMTDSTTPHYIAEAYNTLATIEEQDGNLEAALAALRARPAITSRTP